MHVRYHPLDISGQLPVEKQVPESHPEEAVEAGFCAETGEGCLFRYECENDWHS